MNKQKRYELSKLSDDLNDILSRIEIVCSDEQEAYDNMPERIQNSDKGQKMSEIIQELENAVSSIEEAISSIDTAKE